MTRSPFCFTRRELSEGVQRCSARRCVTSEKISVSQEPRAIDMFDRAVSSSGHSTNARQRKCVAAT